MGRRRDRQDWDRAWAIAMRARDEVKRLAREQQRPRRRALPVLRSNAGRVVRGILWAVFATMAFVPLAFAFGFTIGLEGVAGLVIALLATYGGLLHWMLRKPEPLKPPQLTAGTPEAIALLPAQLGQWLDVERDRLPGAAQYRLDKISEHLEQLTPQVRALPADSPSTAEVRRLLGEELPQLIEGWHKVPVALRSKPLYGGATPERQLLDGLETIDNQIARLHEQLAKDDLHALAAHQRYLDMKYNDKE